MGFVRRLQYACRRGEVRSLSGVAALRRRSRVGLEMGPRTEPHSQTGPASFAKDGACGHTAHANRPASEEAEDQCAS